MRATPGAGRHTVRAGFSLKECLLMRPVLYLVPMLFVLGCAGDPAAVAKKAADRGDELAKTGRLAEALISYRAAAQAAPMAGDVRLKLARAYAQSGEHGKAYAEYVRAADLLPASKDAQSHTAMYLLLSGRFEDARARADKILSQDPRHIDLLIIRAHSSIGLKDLAGARTDVESALALDPSRDGTYVALGELELADGRQEEAEAAFVKATTVQPRAVKPRLALANFHVSQGRYDAAQQAFASALTIDPKDMTANRSLAAFFLSANRLAEAEAPLKTVVAVAPGPDSRFALSDYYLTVNRLSDAEAALRPLEDASVTPEVRATLRTRLATIKARQGKLAEANALLDDVLTADPRNVPALLAKAGLLGATPAGGDAARAHVTRAIEADAQSTIAHYAMGKLLLLSHDHSGAARSFRESARLDSRATGAQFELSRLELAEGRAETAVQYAVQAVKGQPAALENRLQLVRALVAHNELPRARTELELLARQWPTSLAVHTLAGSIALRQRDFATARREFQGAMAGREASLEAIWGGVSVELEAGDPAAAERLIEAQLTNRPDNSALLVLAGRVYAARGDLPRAERVLLRAIELDADAMPAYETLARVYIAGGKLAEATTRFDTMASRQPDSSTASTMAAVLVQAQGRTDEARSRYEKILARDERASVAANNLAWIYADARTNLDMAVQLAQSAVQKNPDSPEVSDTLGWAYYQKDLASLAIPPFRQSTLKDPGNPLYHYHLGLALVKAGDAAKGRQSLEKALTLQKDFEGAEQARRVLGTLGS